MTHLPLDLTVDRLTSWRQVLPTRWWRTARMLGGCLPLSPGELSRLLPELWGTPRAAECWLQRQGQKGTQTPIEILYWEVRTLSAGATLVEYRRPGQRGSASRAWLPGIVLCRAAAGRALWAAGFGELTVERIAETWRAPPPQPPAGPGGLGASPPQPEVGP